MSTNSEFKDVDFSRSVWTSSEATKSTFKRADFRDVSITDSYLNWAVFDTCDFTNARIENSNFYFSKFINCNFTGATITRSNFNKVAIAQSELNDCKIIGSHFIYADITKSYLTGTSIDRFTDLSVASITDCQATGLHYQSGSSDLILVRNSKFSHCNFMCCGGNEISIVSSTFDNTNFMETMFHFGYFDNSTFVQSDFSGSTLIFTTMLGVDCSEANFDDALMEYCEITHTKFSPGALDTAEIIPAS